MATLKWIAIFTVVGYGALVALLYVAQRAMQYFPESLRTAPAEAGLAGAEEVVLDTPTASGSSPGTCRRAPTNRSSSISTAMAPRCVGASSAFAR